MRSVRLQQALTRFIEEAAHLLAAEVAGGAEVAYEIEPRAGRRGAPGTALYCYRALTGEFIAARQAALEQLPGHAEAARLLERFAGMDRYLAGAGADLARGNGQARVRRAVAALLEDVFGEQTNFELRPERLHAALQRLEEAAHASADEVTVVATLHGLSIAAAELPLAKGLTIAQRHALQGLPDGLPGAGDDEAAPPPVVVLTGEASADRRAAIENSQAVLRELLRALRLFGDGRVTLGALAWARAGGGAWSPLVLGGGGRPRGMLLVTAEHEDELRAFCNLVSRRRPEGTELAWALQRFELGCERASRYQALSDYLLALRALLEPEGPASGLLARRLAALCATSAERSRLAERTQRALDLERSIIAGTAVEHGEGCALVEELADHLRALLRDVICGHLAPDLVALAEEIAPASASGEQMLGDAGEPDEVLDLIV